MGHGMNAHINDPYFPASSSLPLHFHPMIKPSGTHCAYEILCAYPDLSSSSMTLDIAVAQHAKPYIQHHTDKVFALNACADSVQSSEFSDIILGIAKEAGERLIVEIATTSQVEFVAAAQKLTQTLRGHQSRIFLDNVGEDIASHEKFNTVMQTIRPNGIKLAPNLVHALLTHKKNNQDISAWITNLSSHARRQLIIVALEVTDTPMVKALQMSCSSHWFQGVHQPIAQLPNVRKAPRNLFAQAM